MSNYLLPIRIILADDHEIFRDGFRVMLKKQTNIKLEGEAANGEELVKLAHELKPDVIVTDIKMPVVDGIMATRQLAEELPHIGVIALSMFDEENLIVDMLEAGAKGYLLKNAHKNEIIAAVEAVAKDHTYFCEHTSPKLTRLLAASKVNPYKKVKPMFNENELSVMRYICEELSNKEIAELMHLSVRTIEGYRDRIQDKIEARNTAGIVVYAIKHKIYRYD
jgi:DNA-binding NarL/FixJ family response regulator